MPSASPNERSFHKGGMFSGTSLKASPPTTESTPPFIDTHMTRQGPGVPAYRFPNSPSPFHSRPVRPTSGRTPTTFNGVVCAQAAHPPPRPTSPPGPVGPDRITRLVDRRRGSFLPRSSWIAETSHLVAPFVVATRFGANQCARTTRHCLAAVSPGSKPASTWSTLPLYGV